MQKFCSLVPRCLYLPGRKAVLKWSLHGSCSKKIYGVWMLGLVRSYPQQSHYISDSKSSKLFIVDWKKRCCFFFTTFPQATDERFCSKSDKVCIWLCGWPTFTRKFFLVVTPVWPFIVFCPDRKLYPACIR